ncbi:hypothetical protein BKA56DRAFT_586098 [Ilyonectria sp. MPI-CAGE-AT-0026]|nr:hypothetical protein BKA56DRAFT_586098 [Ilyonectria sp. MPI-CAGE-AT-0026]
MPPAHACNTCKRRKVKCDGIEPCANCRISGLQCGYNARRMRRAPESPRAIDQTPSPAAASDPNAGFGGAIQAQATLGVAVELQQALTEPQHQSQSPQWLSSPETPDSNSGESAQAPIFHYDAVQVHSALLTGVDALLGSESILDVAHECIDFFVQYLFPNTPVAHEPTLRAAVTLLAFDSRSTLAGRTPASSNTDHITCLRRFALITALCAFVMSTMPAPPPSPSPRSLLSRVFLAASRAMLRVYDAYDLEHPDSTSLTIRMWHSAAMQNTTGRVGTSYQYHAEAAFLAQRLRLHDEASVQQHTKLESQILRASFWLLYLADKTAMALETRPPVLHEAVFDSELTLLDNGKQDEPLLDSTKPVNRNALETRLFVGFHLKRRIWAAAADLLVEIKSFSRREARGEIQSGPERENELTRLSEAYLLFASLADQLPTWLKSPDAASDHERDAMYETVSAYQRSCFWTQRSNIMTVFHCMRLVILQKCVASDLPSVVGLNGQVMPCAMRKIEIVRDFLHELQMVPFRCFKAQGETAVGLRGSPTSFRDCTEWPTSASITS